MRGYNVPKYLFLLLLSFVLSGCQNQPGNHKDQQAREKASIYITALEQELQVMDSLSSKAIAPLISEYSVPRGETYAALNEKFQQAKRQLSAAAVMLEDKVIPADLPKQVREELLAARDDLLRAYRAKLKSLDQLKNYQQTQQTYLFDQYRKLSDESVTLTQEAKAYINNAKRLAEPN